MSLQLHIMRGALDLSSARHVYACEERSVEENHPLHSVGEACIENLECSVHY